MMPPYLFLCLAIGQMKANSAFTNSFYSVNGKTHHWLCAYLKMIQC